MTDRNNHATGRHVAYLPTEMQHGIALIVVLWTLLLLSLIATGFLGLTRTEVRSTRNIMENARAEALADAAVYRAVWDLVTSTSTGGSALLNSPQFQQFLRESGGSVELTRRLKPE